MKSNFIVRGGADFSGIKQEIDKTQKQFKGFQSSISSSLKKIGKIAGIAIGVNALVDFGKQAIETASDLAEVQNVVDKTFGSMAQDIEDFASIATKQYGLSTLSAKQFTSTMGAMLKSSGITGDAMKDMSIEITKLAADMASFYNLDAEEAFSKIRSGISGETEPLKELGINMSVANMEAYAMAQGISKAWDEMTQAEQTMLRYNYLLSVTGDAQGDFARTSGSWANQIKILKERWKEFSALIGEFLIKVLLPVVKVLNKVLDALINIGKAIGNIYTMLTGKEASVTSTVENNNDIADTAIDAAEGEETLADGINEAANAAKKAVAPFDELNVLQQDLSSSEGLDLDNDFFDNLNNESELNTTISTTQVDNSIEESKRKWEEFFVWIGDWWNKIKQTLMIPISIPAPVFPSIPDPIYNPNWGLELPNIETPVFPEIPDPIYNPDWGLDTPNIETPVFPEIPEPIYEPNWNLTPPPVPAVDFSEYGISLEAIKIKTAEIFNQLKTNTKTVVGDIKAFIASNYEEIKQKALEHTEELRQGQAILWEGIRQDTELKANNINTGLVIAWNTAEENFRVHKENMNEISTDISDTVVRNINEGLLTIGENTNNTLYVTQDNWQTWGSNISSIAAETAKGFVENLNEGFKAISENTITFANTQLENLKEWGSGVLGIAAETAKGFVSNMVSGFSTVWDNFKNLMSSVGEKVAGWFKENKSLVLKTTIVAGVAIGAGALALAAPTAIPFAAKGLAGLAAIPALAEGGITNGPTIAMIGDNPGGREVVSPLDDLLDMITSAVGTAVLQAFQISNMQDGEKEIIIELDGTRLGRAILPKINNEVNRLGYKSILQVE